MNVKLTSPYALVLRQADCSETHADSPGGQGRVIDHDAFMELSLLRSMLDSGVLIAAAVSSRRKKKAQESRKRGTRNE